MSVEFVDTNILLYAHDADAGPRHLRSVELLTRLGEDETGAISVQVLLEFYSAATRKLLMESEEAEAVISDLADCSIICTEDFNNGQKYGVVTVRNPFVTPGTPLKTCLRVPTTVGRLKGGCRQDCLPHETSAGFHDRS